MGENGIRHGPKSALKRPRGGFRAPGRSWMGSGWVGAESCPILGGRLGAENVAPELCASSRASHCTNHSKIASERCYDVFMLSLHFRIFDFFISKNIFLWFSSHLLSQMTRYCIRYWWYVIIWYIIPDNLIVFVKIIEKIISEWKKSKKQKCSDNMNTS